MFETEKLSTELENNGYIEVGPFKAERIRKDVYHIDTETKILKGGQMDENGNPNNPSSMYLINHQTGSVMIDLGNPIAQGSQQENSIRTVLLALTQGNPLSVILTHGHFDHTGLASNEQIFKDIQIDQFYVPKQDLSMAMDALTSWSKCITPISNQTISLYGDYYQIVSIGGHTAGSCLIVNREKNIMWTGDTFGSGYVWMLWDSMQDGNPLLTLHQGIQKAKEISASMENPAILAGHRWQQFSLHNPLRPQEITPEYFSDLEEVLNGLLDGSTIQNPYPNAAHICADAVELSRANLHAKIDTNPVFVQNYVTHQK